jgi:MFS family permease
MNTIHAQEKGNLQAWLVCVACGLFFFYEFIQLNVFDVLNPLLRSEMHWEASRMSLLSSAFLWANLIFLIPAGFLLDKYSVKRVVLVALAICITGVALIATAHDLYGLWMGRFLTGIGNAFCFLSCVILVSRWFPSLQQGLVMGLMVTLAFIGGMLAHTPWAMLIQAVGWRHAMDLNVGLGLILWIVLSVVLNDGPAEWSQQTSAEPRSRIKSFLNVLKRAQVYLAGAYTSLLNLPIMVLCALWGSSYLQDVYHYSSVQASAVISFIFLGSMIGCPLLGYISDRQQRRKPMMWIGVVGSWVLTLILYTEYFQSVASLSSLFFLLGFFTSAQVISYPLIAESYSSSEVGEATAVASLIIMGGGAVGQMLFGWLMQSTSTSMMDKTLAESYQHAMWMFPVALTVAALALVKIKETLGLASGKNTQ